MMSRTVFSPLNWHGSSMLCLAGLVFVIGTGCSRNSKPNVGMGMILPPGAEALDMRENESFSIAVEISAPMPAYPNALIGKTRGKIDSCAEIVVAADGSVASVTPLYAIPECPLAKGQVDERFSLAVIEALRIWEFFAAAVCTYPPGLAKDDDCKAEGAVITHVPIKLAYVFTFESETGHASVKRKHSANTGDGESTSH